MKELWTEKYRPKTPDDYVFRDPTQKRTIMKWIAEGAIPHLLLSGSPGVGKSSLAHMILNAFGVQRGDYLWINASQENNVDTIREKVVNFASTMPFGDHPFKYIILDEGDHLSIAAQAILRGILEQFADNCRFIITANYPQKIIPALSDSRCTRFHIEKLDFEEFLLRAAHVLQNEGVAIETEEDANALNTYIQASYPDLRKCINLLQTNIIDNKLVPPNATDTEFAADWRIGVIDLFKAGRITDARKVIAASAKIEEYEEIYRLLYRNLDWWGSTTDLQENAIIIIRDGLRDHTIIADPEINLAATLVRLSQNR